MRIVVTALGEAGVSKGKKKTWSQQAPAGATSGQLALGAHCPQLLLRSGSGLPLGRGAEGAKSQACNGIFSGQGPWTGNGRGSSCQGHRPIKVLDWGTQELADNWRLRRRQGPGVVEWMADWLIKRQRLMLLVGHPSQVGSRDAAFTWPIASGNLSLRYCSTFLQRRPRNKIRRYNRSSRAFWCCGILCASFVHTVILPKLWIKPPKTSP